MNLQYTPLTVEFKITGTPEQLSKVGKILEPHNLKVEMLDDEDFEYEESENDGD